jgi:hypothetical protein
MYLNILRNFLSLSEVDRKALPAFTLNQTQGCYAKPTGQSKINITTKVPEQGPSISCKCKPQARVILSCFVPWVEHCHHFQLDIESTIVIWSELLE